MHIKRRAIDPEFWQIINKIIADRSPAILTLTDVVRATIQTGALAAAYSRSPQLFTMSSHAS